jgi:hypothetical protein
MVNSKCITNNEERKFLLKIFGYKELVTSLLFRGSDHGWTAKAFHLKCDHKSSLICLYKVKKGDCIGGFTSSHWDSTTKPVDDRDAMLFNLTSCRHFPSQKYGNEIRCSREIGPTFGNDELGAYFEPFNGDSSCSSFANRNSFNIPVEDGKNMLTNRENGDFTISELEVWQVEFIL